jgi:hypothetical protein
MGATLRRRKVKGVGIVQVSESAQESERRSLGPVAVVSPNMARLRREQRGADLLADLYAKVRS